jgi:hypothetical protein
VPADGVLADRVAEFGGEQLRGLAGQEPLIVGHAASLRVAPILADLACLARHVDHDHGESVPRVSHVSQVLCILIRMKTPPRMPRRALTAFYVLVVVIALIGQALAAREWLGWPLLFAVPAVAALEFGGVVLSQHALARMRLAENAIVARLLSGAVAAGAVAINWLGHADHLVGAFFAGMSALGYGIWLLDAGARRRDQLRADGMLAVPPPTYGLARWIRRPLITWEARALAVEHSELGLHGSIAEAYAARRREQRHAAIAELLRRKLAQGKDELNARLAIATYDLDEIAARLAAGADYDGLTTLLAADLTAAVVAGVPDTAVDMPTDTEPVAPPIPDTTVTSPDNTPAPAGTPRMSKERAQLVAQSMYLANPDIALDIIADTIGMSTRTVRRYLADIGRPDSAPPAPAVPAPPQMLSPEEAFTALELDAVADPNHRRHLAELVLGAA